MTEIDLVNDTVYKYNFLNIHSFGMFFKNFMINFLNNKLAPNPENIM